ncbi:hypothetical protein G3570_09440 [Balneolaceae bacterium YR4-1]|uniref:Uncharacterized protein n=1 Tax=Halalkalibaculum roseum TaxID=2709311 RepID=A0A6M1T4D1_9BACT|nr:hypothetical protein [Halalkalibaculum roseum]NGP76855.1 hypothetical protein [Halalkalibaculum roseum]
MNTEQLESVWDQQNDPGYLENALSLKEIQKRTNEFSTQSLTSGQRTVILDSAYKALVLSGNIILIAIGIATPVKLTVWILVITSLAFLLYRNIQIKQLFTSINESDPVIDVLQKRYDMLNRYYREFLFSSSITHSLFVLTGFQYYNLFRYGQDRLLQIMNDPVMYLFLLVAFFIPFITQRITYARLMDEMEQVVKLDIDEVEQQLKIIELQSKRRARKVVYATVSLIGIALLILFIIKLL